MRTECFFTCMKCFNFAVVVAKFAYHVLFLDSEHDNLGSFTTAEHPNSPPFDCSWFHCTNFCCMSIVLGFNCCFLFLGDSKI